MFILTLDLDWAPDYMLEYVFKLLIDSGVKATLFATHDSPEIKNVRNIFEFGIHPNVNDLNKVDDDIYSLKVSFPDSFCIRNHKLVFSSSFLPVFKKNGLIVSSNFMMYGQDNIRPISMLYGVYEYPIYYMDDAHLTLCERNILKEGFRRIIGGQGLKVIAFHPIHIYLNSCTIECYNIIKGSLNDKKRVDDFINRGEGIGTLFKKLIADPNFKAKSYYFPRNQASRPA